MCVGWRLSGSKIPLWPGLGFTGVKNSSGVDLDKSSVVLKPVAMGAAFFPAFWKGR